MIIESFLQFHTTYAPSEATNPISRIMIPLFVLFEHGDGQRQGAYRGNGGQREAQQLAEAEMVGKGDGHNGWFYWHNAL